MRAHPSAALAATLVLLAPAAAAGQDLDAVEIRAERVAEGVYMLVGQGGNIGVSVGDDGVFVIDDQFAFIDTASGGSIDGVIAAAGRALAVMDADTKVIPGHGVLSGREDVRAYRDALEDMRDQVARMMKDDRSLDEIQAARPAATYAARWGQDEAAERSFVETIYRSLGGR